MLPATTKKGDKSSNQITDASKSSCTDCETNRKSDASVAKKKSSSNAPRRRSLAPASKLSLQELIEAGGGRSSHRPPSPVAADKRAKPLEPPSRAHIQQEGLDPKCKQTSLKKDILRTRDLKKSESKTDELDLKSDGNSSELAPETASLHSRRFAR